MSAKSLNPWVGEAAAGYFRGLTEYAPRSGWHLLGLLWDVAVHGLDLGGGMDVLGDLGWAPLFAFLPAVWLVQKKSPAVTLASLQPMLFHSLGNEPSCVAFSFAAGSFFSLGRRLWIRPRHRDAAKPESSLPRSDFSVASLDRPTCMFSLTSRTRCLFSKCLWGWSRARTISLRNSIIFRPRPSSIRCRRLR